MDIVKRTCFWIFFFFILLCFFTETGTGEIQQVAVLWCQNIIISSLMLE